MSGQQCCQERWCWEHCWPCLWGRPHSRSSCSSSQSPSWACRSCMPHLPQHKFLACALSVQLLVQLRSKGATGKMVTWHLPKLHCIIIRTLALLTGPCKPAKTGHATRPVRHCTAPPAACKHGDRHMDCTRTCLLLTRPAASRCVEPAGASQLSSWKVSADSSAPSSCIPSLETQYRCELEQAQAGMQQAAVAGLSWCSLIYNRAGVAYQGVWLSAHGKHDGSGHVEGCQSKSQRERFGASKSSRACAADAGAVAGTWWPASAAASIMRLRSVMVLCRGVKGVEVTDSCPLWSLASGMVCTHTAACLNQHTAGDRGLAHVARAP